MRYPRELKLRPSRRIRTLMLSSYMLAASAFFFSSLSVLWVLAGCAVLGVSCWWEVRQSARKQVRTLVLGDDGLLVVDRHEGLLPLSATDFGWALWLTWRQEGGRRVSLMMAPDMLPAADWRSLRIWVRHKAVYTQDARGHTEV